MARLSGTGLNKRSAPPPRVSTGHQELDRVLGGGLVEASVTLVGGDPGIGKSTLLLQMAANLSVGRGVSYISGEESEDQIQLRARRLGVEQASVELFASNDGLAIADYIETQPRGSVVIVDSLQTLHCGGESAPGSVSQVKLSAAHLIPAAKDAGVSLILVSQVTKEGSIAGPNVVAHAVDTTLYVETDLSAGLYHLVRSQKNRFGPADEVGVFEMTERGMVDIANPSEVFISQRDETAFGSVIFPSLEGTRPLLLEVQALVAPTFYGTGRRSANGWDTTRMNMLLATLSARLGVTLTDNDVYVNVAGGLKVDDPAMDLAVAAAILSAHAQAPLPKTLAVFGEIGLAGEVRNSSRAEARIKEATQLGLTDIVCPDLRDQNHLPSQASVKCLRRVSELLTEIPELTKVYSTSTAE
jgi:DNA repair protein RadA/Sms